jgi:membrane-bound serine protease (ClpP class)
MDNLTLAYVLLAVSVVLMVAELFVPTGGTCFFLAALCAIAGIVLIFMYGDKMTGVVALLGVFVAAPFLLSALFYLWPHSLWGRRLIPRPEDDMTVAAMPGNALLEQLQGRIGRTVSPLRPAGIVDFEGKRIDCVTEGMMIDADRWVRCIEVKSGRVVVRLIDKPNLADLENSHFGA